MFQEQSHVSIACRNNNSMFSFPAPAIILKCHSLLNQQFQVGETTIRCFHCLFHQQSYVAIDGLKNIVVLIVLSNNSSNCFHDIHKNNSQMNYKFLLFAETSMLNSIFALLAQAIMSNFHCLPKQKVYDCIPSKQHFPILIACPNNSSTFLLLAQR